MKICFKKRLVKIYQTILFSLLLVFIVNCSSNSGSNYHGYFFQSKTADGSPAFSYILYLGDIRDRNASNKDIGVVIDTREENRELRSSSRPQGDKNEADSFSFRMEEEAYKRLESKLSQLQYCENDIEYTLSEYDWLKYTIKGYCK